MTPDEPAVETWHGGVQYVVCRVCGIMVCDRASFRRRTWRRHCSSRRHLHYVRLFLWQEACREEAASAAAAEEGTASEEPA